MGGPADFAVVWSGTRRDAAPVEDERALALRARTDADAFAALYRRYVGPIHTFAFRRCGSRDTAEDVTAATFERAWRAMPTFEWKGSGFEPWLFRIAARELAAWYRREGRSLRPRADLGFRALLPTEPATVDAPGPDAAQLSAIRAALPRLTSRYEQAISLRDLSGLSIEEAAEAMGCTRPVMAVTVHRALAALRREIQRGGRA